MAAVESSFGELDFCPGTGLDVGLNLGEVRDGRVVNVGVSLNERGSSLGGCVPQSFCCCVRDNVLKLRKLLKAWVGGVGQLIVFARLLCVIVML